MDILLPRLDILSSTQRRLWDRLNTIPDDFVLYRGTAIALRLAHRASVDFDFFTNRNFTPGELEQQMPLLRQAERLQSSPNTLACLLGAEDGAPVKLSFFGDLGMARAGKPQRVSGPGFWVASLLDLAATKAKVVQDRAEAKDYLDMAALLDAGVSLKEALAAACAVYGMRFNPMLSLKALTYFSDGDLPSLPEAVKSRLQRTVAATDVIRLPALPAIQAIAPDLVPRNGA